MAARWQQYSIYYHVQSTTHEFDTPINIRYEDKNPNSDARNPFAAGITLDSLILKSSDTGDKSDGKLKLFGKLVELSSLAFYWKPNATLYSTKDLHRADDNEINNLFNEGIASNDNMVRDMKYLLHFQIVLK